MSDVRDRGEIMLDLIYDEVDQRMNPSDEACPECGGEGYIADCFDGMCIDAEYGCDDCTRRCLGCVEYTRDRLKAVREEVIKSSDIDIAIAWLKGIGRWRDDITREQVADEMAKASAIVSNDGDSAA